MTLEDILKIDTCPFDDTVLDECLTGNCYASSALRANLCNLILRYLNLFWQKYQPEIAVTYDRSEEHTSELQSQR